MVTGASRGLGKGIALGLGEAGATVYVTEGGPHAQSGESLVIEDLAHELGIEDPSGGE